jgi:hypothetical protein
MQWKSALTLPAQLTVLELARQQLVEARRLVDVILPMKVYDLLQKVLQATWDHSKNADDLFPAHP